jgi:adenylate cyclase
VSGELPVVEKRLERRLSAILAADVAGYSRLTGYDEEGTLIRLRAIRRDLAEPAIASHGGRLVKTTGDGMLVEFASVVDAVRCAIEVQRMMAQQDRNVSAERQIQFRVGINLGDVVVEADEDLMGDGVNVAARLEGMAEPGSICLSRAAYEQVKGKVDAHFTDMGEQRLKNIADPVRVFRIDVAPAVVESPPRPTLTLPDRPSIAVLPFTNMSGDPEQDYFCDGMVEDIITGLSRIRWLFVIARNSSFIYKGRAVDVKQVGRELGVRYVLEGSVRKSGNRVRITGQLVDAHTGMHLWAERYDRALDDVFALQDEMTLAVIGAIEPSLRAAEIERVKRKRPDSLDAYDLVLRALPLLYTAMPEDAAKAMPFLEGALKLEPTYGIAHAQIAWYLHIRFSRGGLREEDRIAAVRHARAATTHGNDDATALALAGFVIALDGRDSDTALKLFDRALAISSSNIFALGFSAVTLAWMGRSELAITRAQLALRLSPYDSLRFLSYIALAQSYFYKGHFEAAAEAAQSAIDSNPRFSVPRAMLAAALVRLGRAAEANAAAQRVLELQPGFTIRGFAQTVGIAADVYARFAAAWREVGLPD